MKSLLSLLRCDFTNARRDSVLIYVILSPLLLAVAVSLFVPALGKNDMILATDSSVTIRERDRLERYCELIVLDGRQKLVERVERDDDVPGVYREGDHYVLLLDGRESDALRELMKTILADSGGTVLSRDLTVGHEQIGEKRFHVRDVLALMMAMLASLIGGMTIGFNIVEERSSGMTRAFSVTPLKTRTYAGAKSIFAGLLGFVVSLCSLVIILGFRLPWGRVLTALCLSVLVSSLFGFFMGRFAENQIGALGMTKVLMPVYLTIPLVSVFIPLKFHWFFIIFPQYWLFSAFQTLLIPGTAALAGFWINIGIYTVSTALLLFVIGRNLGRMIGLQRG